MFVEKAKRHTLLFFIYVESESGKHWAEIDENEELKK